MEEENEITHKKWFLAKPFIDKFVPQGDSTLEGHRLANRLGVEYQRIQALSKPGCIINYITADRYAVKLRISSS